MKRWTLGAVAGAANVALALILVGSADAHAEEAERPWLFLPVYTRGLPPPSQAAIVDPWQRAVHATVDNTKGAIAEEFSQQHSAAPTELSSQKLAELKRGLGRALRAAAFGEIANAEASLDIIRKLPTSELDALMRAPGNAQTRLDVCLNRAYMLDRCGADMLSRSQVDVCIARDEEGHLVYEQPERRPADVIEGEVKAVLHACLADFPGRELGEWMSTPFGPMLEVVQSELARESRATLVINQPPQCDVQLNGVPLGQAPLTLSPVRRGASRVQLTCAGVVGRSHHVFVAEGANTVNIDPVFDAAVVTSKSGIALQYQRSVDRDQRGQRDGEVIALALRARVVLLVVDRDAVRVEPVGDAGGTQSTTPQRIAFANGRYEAKAFAAAVKAFGTREQVQ